MQGSDMNFYAYTTREVKAGEELTLPYPHPAARPDQALFHYGFLPGGAEAAEPKLAALDLPDGTLHSTPIFSEEDYRTLPPPPCMTGPPCFRRPIRVCARPLQRVLTLAALDPPNSTLHDRPSSLRSSSVHHLALVPHNGPTFSARLLCPCWLAFFCLPERCQPLQSPQAMKRTGARLRGGRGHGTGSPAKVSLGG